jgi:hypothetical protein
MENPALASDSSATPTVIKQAPAGKFHTAAYWRSQSSQNDRREATAENAKIAKNPGTSLRSLRSLRFNQNFPAKIPS